jgi:hypothetical protein
MRSGWIALGIVLLSFAAKGQTVSIVRASAGKEAVQGNRWVLVEISIANNKKVPLAFSNRFFYLSSEDDGPTFNGTSVEPGVQPFELQLAAGKKQTERLLFQVPAGQDPMALKLCMHAPDSSNWDDYLEIPFRSGVPASAPMWHPARPGVPMDNMTYGPESGTTPPKLLHTVDPKLAPQAAQYLAKLPGRALVCNVSLIVDREGNPHQVRVIDPVRDGFDVQAVNAVKQYRFAPAKDKDGEPVAVRVVVSVNLRTP